MSRHVRLFSLLIVLLVALVPLLAVPVAAQQPIAFASYAATPVARPGQAVQVQGIFGEGVLGQDQPVPRADVLHVQLHGPDGQRIDLGEVTTDADGTFSVTVPAQATADLQPGTQRSGWRETWAVRAVTAGGQQVAGAGAVTFA